MITSSQIHAASILVVDDMEPNIALLKGILHRDGYTNHSHTQDPRQVCALHKENHYDLILLDLHMPGMDGFEVMAGLQALEVDSYLPVLVITAQPGHVLRALKCGARDFISKPFDLAEVLMRVRNFLEVRLLHKELSNHIKKVELRNRFICETFGRYLSEEIMERLLEAPEAVKLGAHTHIVTLIMADLRGFTSLSENLPPAKVGQIVNNFLDKMVEIMLSYGGTIDGFTGDGLLGLFGAPTQRPDDAERAVSCALAMQLAMEKVNKINVEMGLPVVEMGIGLHTGEVVIGNIGSAQRAKYGALGSAVNLTARIESYTTGGQVMISQSTFDAIADLAISEPPIVVEPKGISVPITLHLVIGLRGRPELGLPIHVSPQSPPVAALQVQFTEVPDKDAPGSTPAGSSRATRGQVLHLCPTSADISAVGSVPRFTNIKMQFARDGAGLAGDLYGKVCESDETKDSFTVRFTSAPEQVQRVLGQVEAAAAS